MIKHAVCYAPYIRNHTSYDRHLWHTSLKWWYLQVFFYFFQILIFQVVSRVKSEKLTQNDKKFCLSCSMSQEPYIIWSSLVIRKCKMIISLGFSFFFFFLFWFFGLLGGWKGKKWPKMTKNCPFCLTSQELCIMWSWFLVHICKMMTSPDSFFIFS